jgi:hypothetical protein
MFFFFVDTFFTCFLCVYRYRSGNYAEEATYLLTVVTCLWNLLGCDENEDVFLEQRGAFMILELLDKHKDRRLVGNLLGCLVDLLDNPRVPLIVFDLGCSTRTTLDVKYKFQYW